MTLRTAITTVKTRLIVGAIAGLAVLAPGAILAESTTAAPSGGIGEPTSEPDSDISDGRGRSTNYTPRKYESLWERVKVRDRRWARKTAECESGRDPNAIGGPGGRYRGAFQFLRSTWKGSPKSPGGDPINYSYRTQAVVAVALKRRDGAGHWPVCG